MSTAWPVVTVAIGVALLTGCSGGHPEAAGGTPAAASANPGATGTAPVIPLDSRRCGVVNEANVDLLAASSKEAARKAADTLESYQPPAAVKAAIEHFVGTDGAHFDDPDYTTNHKILGDWVTAVCPT